MPPVHSSSPDLFSSALLSGNPSEQSPFSGGSLNPLFPSSSLSVGLSSGSTAGEVTSVFAQVRSALSAFLEKPDDAELLNQLLATRRAAAAQFLKFPRKETQSAIVDEARQLVREISASGLHDRRVTPEDYGVVETAAKKGWQGLLAAMLLVPASQWADAPLLLTVPDWLRADYVEWLFSPPQGFSEVGQAEAYADYTLGRLEELVRWMDRSPGAAAEAEVLGIYASKSSAIPLYFSVGSLRRHAELRGRLLQRALGQPDDFFEPVPNPRQGRRLRVGIVNRHFSSQTETYTSLPTFEQLDPERFEVILFCHQTSGSSLEAYCCQHTSGFVVLPGDIEGQLSVLREAALDVVVFGTNITAVCNEVLRIALHRVAPLQVINNSSCITSGLTSCDLYVSGNLTETAEAAAHFSERLGLLPGPTHAFNYEADRQEPQATCQRSDFGLPEDALVFVSAANYFKVIPEVQHAWAKLLAASPGSYLLVHPFNPNWSSSYPIKRFQAEFEAVLTSHGVAASRLKVSSISFPSRTDVKTLLGLGNIYLDSHPFGGVNSLIDPLELGMPVVTWEGGTMRARMGSALMRALEIPGLIAASGDEYQKIAVRLATDAAFRAEMGAAIRGKMERAPVFLDSLAASEAFGDLLEKAFDEMVAVGRDAFRSNREPLLAFDPKRTKSTNPSLSGPNDAREVLRSTPNQPKARHAIGRALLEAGRAPRASLYLLAALQGEEAKADLWIDVARALKAEGKFNEALQALEAGINLDQKAIEGWVLYAELAYALGSVDIAREAAGVAKQLAPNDTRVLAYL